MLMRNNYLTIAKFAYFQAFKFIEPESKMYHFLNGIIYMQMC